MKNLLWIVILVFFIGACTSNGSKQTKYNEEINAIEVNTQPVEVLATDLNIPWNITKHDQIFYLSQRSGSVIKVDGSTGTKTVQNVVVSREVLHLGEGGLLGFILAPDFPVSKEAIAYHTYEKEGRTFNRVIVLKLSEETWNEQRVLLDKIPGGSIHNGGRVKVGPDRKLYITVGDAGQPENAQNVNSLAGKILRMELDGTIPNDNPFKNSYVYSYGHRNPQGLAWDDAGNFYSTEHGQSAHDEINLIVKGGNYGWPLIEGEQQAANMTSPIFHTGEVTWAPSGIEIKDNKIYIATLRGESIRSYNLTNGTVETFFQDAGRLRDVLIEKDALFTITNNRDGRGTPRENDDQLFKFQIK
ncbi:PQQ-dependent sugar dehydrogenase [Bacillus sp. Marseille-P3661]|uniref:PQQ-dependent sugar dehydrogenase n=1 Tax=Bacillus sp. Marseille-P3661 TaxID=1936234 RepID=UPI002155E253|nr:PQQ-dependent sugar dehydrogenase [Bacillus sp. Marseille-P3661]